MTDSKLNYCPNCGTKLYEQLYKTDFDSETGIRYDTYQRHCPKRKIFVIIPVKCYKEQYPDSHL